MRRLSGGEPLEGKAKADLKDFISLFDGEPPLDGPRCPAPLVGLPTSQPTFQAGWLAPQLPAQPVCRQGRLA